jgi:hypothetical protein
VYSSTKSKTISLRISIEEYQAIKNRCTVAGDLNVSEFVRAATLRALASRELSAPPTYLQIQMATIFSRLEKLEERLAATAIH